MFTQLRQLLRRKPAPVPATRRPGVRRAQARPASEPAGVAPVRDRGIEDPRRSEPRPTPTAIGEVAARRDPPREPGPVATAAPSTPPVAVPARVLEEPPMPAPLDASRDGLVRLLHARLTAFSDAHGGAAAADMRSLVGSIVRDPTGGIPQLPESAQQAMALTREAHPAVPKVTAAFERDPSLAQALLQQANSATYANLGTCASVRDALLRLGMAGARAVLLSHAVDGLFATRALVHREAVSAIASHLVRTATIARHLAPAFEAARDEAYTAALLHDVGKLVLLDRLTHLRDDWRREPRIPWPLLSGLLAESHEALGGLTLQGWGLGEAVVSAVAAHHRNPAPLDADRIGQVLCLAERVDIAIVAGAPFDLAALMHRHRLTGVAPERVVALLPPMVLTAEH